MITSFVISLLLQEHSSLPQNFLIVNKFDRGECGSLKNDQEDFGAPERGLSSCSKLVLKT